MDTDVYLHDNERPIIATAILAGAWLEGLYIAVNLETDSSKAHIVWEKIGEQKPALSNLVKMLVDAKDERFNNLIMELKKLVILFDKVKLNSSINKSNQVEVLKVNISDDLFYKIQEKTSDIRDVVTK